jgi:hypothetical protein
VSVEVIGAVLQHSPTSGNAKVILLGLANHAHPDGSSAYPSVATLARYARVDHRTVQRQLRALERDGHVERTGVGPAGQTCWRVVLPCPKGGRQSATPPADCQGGAVVTLGAAPVPPPPVAPVPPEPSVKPSLKPSDPPTPRRGAHDGDELLPTKPTGNRKRAQDTHAAAMRDYWHRHFADVADDRRLGPELLTFAVGLLDDEPATATNLRRALVRVGYLPDNPAADAA